MTREAGRVDDEDPEERPAQAEPLANWLTGPLRASSRAPAAAESEAAAPAIPAPPALPVESAEAAATAEPEVEVPAAPADASDDSQEQLAGDEPIVPGDEQFSAAADELDEDEPPAEPAEQPSTLAPQVLPSDALADDDGEDPTAAFLAREQRARRKQRIALAALGLILLGVLVVIGFRLRPKPKTTPAEPSVAAAPAALPEVPAPSATTAQAPPLDPEEEAAEPSGSAGAVRASGGLGAPAAAGDTPAALGPSVGRFPDLPREVLIELEKSTEKQ